MILLGIETSCDETAASVVKNGRDILSSQVGTQFEHHRPYSGVVPELASRAHVKLINAVVEEALRKAQLSFSKLNGIAVTVGPGLVGSLLVGRMTAEALGWATGLRVYGANHIEGHLLSAVLYDRSIKPPFLGLVVSGGHTELIFVKKWGHYALVGRTRDDAAGEAFDKVAKMLDLGYPGGPIIDTLAKTGDHSKQPFPVPWLPLTWDFSFSGLKTAVLYRLRERKTWTSLQKADLCAGFQRSVVDVLVGKTLSAARALHVDTVVVGGGVAANSHLRKRLEGESARLGIRTLMTPLHLCTDNAAMVAAAVWFKLQNHQAKPFSLSIQPQLHVPFLSRPPRAPSRFQIPLEN